MDFRPGLFWLLVAIAGTAQSAQYSVEPFYTAAVVEYVRQGDWMLPPEETVAKNLASYQKAAEVAKTHGSQIIVFPEYGLFPPNSRSARKPFMENIPDPNSTYVNPCLQKDAYVDRPILRTLSCIANNNEIYVVANMGDIKTLSSSTKSPPEQRDKEQEDANKHHKHCFYWDPFCHRKDDDLQYNTNVVFDRKGTLILKYYKEHPHFEGDVDVVEQQQDPVFRTDFGTFATFIGFDINFKKMADVAASVDAVLLSSNWIDVVPLFNTVQYWQSWALGNKATLLVSNVHLPGLNTVGSGIFTGETGALAYSFNPDGASKVIVARVPRKDIPQTNDLTEDAAKVFASNGEEHWPYKNDDSHVPRECSGQILKDTRYTHSEYRCVDDEFINKYSLVKLIEKSGHIEACHNRMCCKLDYITANMSETFYFGVFNGTHEDDRYNWCVEKCILVRCDPVGGKPCATFPRRSETKFNAIHMTADFSADHVYPSLLSSGNRLVPLSEWEHEYSRRHCHIFPFCLPKDGDLTEQKIKSKNKGILNFKSQKGENIILAGFEGRCFDRDKGLVN